MIGLLLLSPVAMLLLLPALDRIERRMLAEHPLAQRVEEPGRGS